MGSRLVFVQLAAPYAAIKYGFRTTVKDSTSATLGHQALTALTPVAGLILRANTPKPRRASRRTATGIESSFVAPGAVVAAIAAGYDIVKARPNGRKRNTIFQVAVYVTLNGVKYAWGMRKTQKAKLAANFGALGIQESTGLEDDLVFGASFPKPPKAKSLTFSGDTTISSSIFYDPTNEVQVKALFSDSPGSFTQADWGELA